MGDLAEGVGGRAYRGTPLMRALRVLLIGNGGDAETARVREQLEDIGSEIISVPALPEAFDYLEDIDVAVLDFVESVQVLSAIDRIHAELPALPVVVLTNDADEEVGLAAMQAGAQDYLMKRDVTAASLRRALRYAFERGELRARVAASIEELQRQRASVLQLSQLKNDLIAVLAHDIKGPLTSIVGFAELLEEGFLEGDAAVDAAKTIRSNAQRLATLANDVLALSRVEHGALDMADERVELNALVRDVVELHAPERQIEMRSGVDSAIVRGDSERLKQVFDNLIRNAIKYSPNGAPVTVRISPEGDSYVVSVRDRGIGVPPEEIGRVFDRFSRGSNARKAKISGTGIGLFIVKTIVERHGGDITVESSLDEGSTFSVRLPSVDAEESLRPMRVTLLTTDAALSRFVAYELRTRGYRVREAQTVEAAVSGVRNGDVIVADDGITTPRELREALGSERAVRLVSLGDGRDAAWDVHLSKPFLVADLLAAVDVPAGRLVRQ